MPPPSRSVGNFAVKPVRVEERRVLRSTLKSVNGGPPCSASSSTRPCTSGMLSLRMCATVGAMSALAVGSVRSEEHTSELQSRGHLVCRLLLEKKKVVDVNEMIADEIKIKIN